jgi:hypothetical protein
MLLPSGERSARGQVVVIVAVGLTVLVAMAGIVIDGGLAWSNRRQLQNAADSAALAGTRILGLDLKWRATGSGGTPPFASPDTAVCDAINEALVYNTNGGQTIAAIDCYAGSPEAVYVDFDHNALGQVGDGIPSLAQGVRVSPTSQQETLLMRVVGISTVDLGADATALAGPAAPPLGLLMPFVVQNPLSPFVPGDTYEVRSESEGECGTASVSSDTVASMVRDSGLTFAAARNPLVEALELAAPGQPSVPVANPDSTTFVASITVSLSAESGARIYYTTDGTNPTAASPQYTTPLTFTSTTLLKAIAIKGGKSSDIGNYVYTQGTPPDAVTATPGDGTEFSGTVDVTLSTTTSGATIYYTTNRTNPTTSSSIYAGTLTFSATTQLRAFAWKAGASSPTSTFNYTLEGDTLPPEATPGDGTEFETTLNVSLASGTAGASIYYTVDGSTPTTSSTLYAGPLSLVTTTTVKAFATAGGADSEIVEFTYTKTGEVCPDLTSGNFGWVDFSGGSNSNADLIDDIEHPENADIDWYYDTCTSASDTNCRDAHDAADPADDHWRLEGTSGHRNVALRTACDLYLGQVIYVPIWDSFETMTKKPNGNNAVFHLIGFAAFRLDGIIDNKNNGDPSADACGAGAFTGQPNDKGFVGTYVDSFVGTQVAPCIPSADGTNPCSNLSNDELGVNLSD